MKYRLKHDLEGDGNGEPVALLLRNGNHCTLVPVNEALEAARDALLVEAINFYKSEEWMWSDRPLTFTRAVMDYMAARSGVKPDEPKDGA